MRGCIAESVYKLKQDIQHSTFALIKRQQKNFNIKRKVPVRRFEKP